MQGTVAKWGNCLAVRIPSPVAKQLGLRAGAPVDIKIVGDDLVIRRAKPRFTLDELVAAMTPENQHDVVFDGGEIGAEVVEWRPQ